MTQSTLLRHCNEFFSVLSISRVNLLFRGCMKGVAFATASILLFNFWSFGRSFLQAKHYSFGRFGHQRRQQERDITVDTNLKLKKTCESLCDVTLSRELFLALLFYIFICLIITHFFLVCFRDHHLQYHNRTIVKTTSLINQSYNITKLFFYLLKQCH